MSDELQNQADVAAPESEATAAPETVETTQPEEHQEPKTFTQEELDNIVGERLAKERRKMEREMHERAQEAQRKASVPTEAPKPEQFATAEEYADALADFKVGQKLAEREARQQQRQVESTYAEREEEARSKYSDFEEVAYNPNLTITPAMADVIKASEVGPELAYHLGSNPKEAERIANLPPLVQAKELGKIEATLASNPPVAKKASSAPEPIKPVGTRASTPKYDTTDPRSVKTMSTSEWIEAERERQARKLRAQQS